MEASSSPEIAVFTSEHFGTVTNKRVTYEYRKGFSGRSWIDIPLSHVTSVSLETTRSWPLFALMLLVGVACLPSPNFNVKCIGATAFLLDVLVYMGSPTIVVNTAGNDRQKKEGSFWRLREAKAFVKAIRGQLFK